MAHDNPETARAYYQANKEKICARVAQARAADPQAAAAYYQANKERLTARARARYRAGPRDNVAPRDNREYLRARRVERQGMLDYMKRAYGCVDCGTKTGRLDYDHVRGTKLFPMSACTRAWSAILAEIEKCEVRCVRCHATRHGAAV